MSAATLHERYQVARWIQGTRGGNMSIEDGRGIVWPTDAEKIEAAINAMAEQQGIILALRSEVERQTGVIAALDRTVEELSGEIVELRAALARVADCSSYALLCTACKNAVAAALLGDEEEGSDA